jgi:exopolysaccharide production protein ExoY
MTVSFSDFESDFQRVRSVFADPSEGALPVQAVQAQPIGRGPYRRFFKRMLDVTAIVLAVPVVLPVIAVAAMMVARDGGSPFYTQMRVGMGGRAFRMWKLRTMVCDADSRMEAYLAENPAARLEWDTTQKLKADPRITKMGKFLRKSSLDELPQLWNVVLGDMSLVGPRPMMINQQTYIRARPITSCVRGSPAIGKQQAATARPLKRVQNTMMPMRRMCHWWRISRCWRRRLALLLTAPVTKI